MALPFTFAIIETGIRFVIPQPLAPTLYRFHPVYSFFLEPSKKSTVENFDYKISINVNSLGFRGKEFNLGNNNNNILVIGDSYAFGAGVENNETFPALLEQYLSKTGNPINIMNTSVPAWGSTQKLLFLQREGNKYNPDLILWQFCETDFEHNLQFDLHDVVDDSLVYTPPELSTRDRLRTYAHFIPFYGWLVQKSHMVSLIRRTVLLGINKHSKTKNYNSSDKILENNTNNEKQILMEKLSQEILKTSKNMNIPILPIFIPSGGKEIQRNGYNPVVQSLFKSFKEKNIFFIDFTYIGFDESIRFNSDGHWKPLAHKIAADSIYNHIISKSYLK